MQFRTSPTAITRDHAVPHALTHHSRKRIAAQRDIAPGGRVAGHSRRNWTAH
jgi:hypothetical protein